MLEPIELEVKGIPPAKDGGLSIRNPCHPDHTKVRQLREAMSRGLLGKTRFADVRVHVRVTMHYRRSESSADALNLVNGVADTIQRRCAEQYACDLWIIADDSQVKQLCYTEEPATEDSYVIRIEEL